MKFREKIKTRLAGLTKATGRFPLTTLFLISAAIINIININSDINYDTYIVTFILGAFLSATGQVIYERFFTNKKSFNFIIMGVSILLSLAYFFIIKDSPVFGLEISVRTSVAMFAVFIAFILIPTIKREFTFNESFLISFKSFFVSLFFSLVIFGGIALILGAVDQLLFNINYKWFSYSATLIFFIFSPLFFLSMIPVFESKPKGEYEQYTNVPRLLEILISYIIIPISGVFTLILLIYILLNVRGDFWTNNLLEPMLVSYSISIILIYILSSLLENKFALLFRKIAPKILVPIVIFQVVASVLKIQELGITHSRYFVILYGIYAVAAGVILSIVPVRKNGIIAALLIIFSIVSIVPPVDAFTVSKYSQISTLEKTLIENQMLENNKIIPRTDLNNVEKKKIANSINYLSRMEYFEDVDFIPVNFETYRDFENTFGFRQYENIDGKEESLFLSLKSEQALEISGYDFMTNIYADNSRGNNEFPKNLVTYQGANYNLVPRDKDKDIFISLLDENGVSLIEFPVKEIINRFYNDSNVDNQNNEISLEEASFIVENNTVRMKIILQDFFIDKRANYNSYWGSLNVLIDFK